MSIDLIGCFWRPLIPPPHNVVRLAPRERRRLTTVRIRGFVWYAMLISDNPDVAITVTVDGVELPAISPRRLYDAGCVGYTCVVADVTRFDDAARRYVAVLRGPIPMDANAAIDAVNESGNEALITVAGAYLDCPMVAPRRVA